MPTFTKRLQFSHRERLQCVKTSSGIPSHLLAVRKFSDFLRLALEKDCDLALSPEYSCPWEVLSNALKTHPMGGNNFERDHLIPGSQIYIWHNPDDRMRLLSLICSDALAFDTSAIGQCAIATYPYLVFHPQLTPDPRHADISTYRFNLFGQPASANLDVIGLNWARSSLLSSQRNVVLA